MHRGTFQPGAVRGRLWGRSYVSTDGMSEMKRQAHRLYRRVAKISLHLIKQTNDGDADLFPQVRSAPGGTRTHDPRLRSSDFGDRSESVSSPNRCKHWGSAICRIPSVGNKSTVSQKFCYQICYQDSDASQAGGLGFEGGPLLTVREVAAVLGVSTWTVYELCEHGELVHIRVRNAIRVGAAALKLLLKPKRSKA